MNPADDAQARNRFFVLSSMRFFGAVMAIAGFILIAGKWSLTGDADLDRYLGIGAVLFGAFDFAVVPMLLARQWRSPRDL